MGAGKSTIGREVARLTQRPFVDTDEEIERRHGPVARIFEERGEPEFRRLEEEVVREALGRPERAVIALGGGSVESEHTRAGLRRAFVVWIRVESDVAWERARRTDRPLARDEADFRRLFRKRDALYGEAADAFALDADDVVLASLRILLERPKPTEGPVAVIADEAVLDLHAPPYEEPVYRVPAGERAKTPAVVHGLWRELELDRDGTIHAFGGGSTTDVAGFVASTYLRGIRWVAWPTTLTGQIDAAIGGKTGIDLGKGKNLVGAFHFPRAVVIDPSVLSTLPDRERRNGMAEVVKTGLLAGREVWELPEEEMIRACAAYKAAVVLSDPFEESGRRSILNLGHTFAHALEAASGYSVSHGEAVALGLLAALRLSGLPTDVVEEVLDPRPVRLDRERAWAALQHDKKAREGRIRLVLLEAPGKPVFPAELPHRDVRAALDALVAD